MAHIALVRLSTFSALCDMDILFTLVVQYTIFHERGKITFPHYFSSQNIDFPALVRKEIILNFQIEIPRYFNKVKILVRWSILLLQ